MEIKHGEKLFEFASKAQWVNKAQRIWKIYEVRAADTVCVDQLGRMCNIGKHFMDAERDNAYPIEVFRMREEMTPNAQVNQQKCGAFLSALNRQLCLWRQGEEGQLAQFATFD